MGHAPPFRVSELPSPAFSAGNFQQIKTKANLAVVFSAAPNGGFRLIALKTLFRLSRVLSDLQKCILRGVKKIISVRSSKGNLNLFDNGFSNVFPKILAAI